MRTGGGLTLAHPLLISRRWDVQQAIRAHGSRGAASDAVALYRRARVAPRLRRGASGKLSATQVNEHRQLLSAALVACARAADATLAVTLLHEVEEEGGKVLDPPHVATN